MQKIALLILVTLALSACTIGKDYQRSPVDTPKSWRFEEKEARQVTNPLWWEQFNDPVLDDLIQKALKENKDLLIAAARIEEYMGKYGATRADQFPRVDAGGSAGQQRITETGHAPLSPGFSPTYDSYQVQLNASWEIDLWGKLRRGTEAARADLLSTEEARQAVVLTLVTSVASSYVQLRNLDQQLEIARQTAQTRKESLDLFNLRFEGGVVSELELSQVKSEYEDARATIPQMEKSIAQQENALNLLLGQNPGPVPRGLTINDLKLPTVPVGLPSDLLERRPDIRQTEQQLIAANARISVAKAQYFPSISLTGLLGYASADLIKLFNGPSLIWNYGASVSAPIFTAGRIQGQVKAAEAQQLQALLRYQQAIQTAFREVEDALVDQNKSRERLEAQARQMAALKTYRDLARLRYDDGYSSYLEVLDAERSFFNVQLSYIQTRGSLFNALVNLYKSMGGGWSVEAEKKKQSHP
jgi:outer membrane protein, multidrug efflux system